MHPCDEIFQANFLWCTAKPRNGTLNARLHGTAFVNKRKTDVEENPICV